MENVDCCISQVCDEHGHREPIEEAFDGRRELLGLPGGSCTTASLGKWSSTRTHANSFIVAGLSRGDHRVGYEGHGKEEQQEDRVTCAQVLQQLASCMGIHVEPNAPTNIRPKERNQSISMTQRCVPDDPKKKGGRESEGGRLGGGWKRRRLLRIERSRGDRDRDRTRSLESGNDSRRVWPKIDDLRNESRPDAGEAKSSCCVHEDRSEL